MLYFGSRCAVGSTTRREETPAAAQLWVSVCLCKHSTLHEEEAAAVLARPDLLECWLPCAPHVPRGGEGSFNLSAGGNGSTLALPCELQGAHGLGPEMGARVSGCCGFRAIAPLIHSAPQ